MDDEQFEEHVRAALDSLPDEIAEGLENVAVVIEDESPESPDILGMLLRISARGAGRLRVPCRRRSSSTGGRSRRRFPSPAELERQIRITVLHELAHYFGIDEDRIAELGYR